MVCTHLFSHGRGLVRDSYTFRPDAASFHSVAIFIQVHIAILREVTILYPVRTVLLQVDGSMRGWEMKWYVVLKYRSYRSGLSQQFEESGRK
jgi:hypothetical protein